MKYINIEMNEKRFHKIEEIITNSTYPVMSKREFEMKVSQIKTIYGFKTLPRDKIIEKIISSNLMNREIMTADNQEPFEVYSFPKSKIDIFDITASRSRGAYFSYYSALFINNLTLQIPKQLYLTNERPKDYNDLMKAPTQELIDRAFDQQPRVTSNKRYYKEMTINWINGQYHNKLGVVPFREIYYTTDLERTLIDIVVRPFYAGGVTQVLEAFVNARKSINIERLIEYYKKMNFVYPYHQAIGFYMEKAGYKNIDLSKVEDIKQMYKFYLSYNIKFKEYSDRWNLYYPKGL